MPTKYDRILIEPSTDINIALDTLKAQKVRIHLLGVKYPKEFSDVKPENLENITRAIELGKRNGNEKSGYDIELVDGNTIVSLTVKDFNDAKSTHFLLESKGRKTGTTHIQFRLVDPEDLTKYHYLVVRVTVHRKLISWWFGNHTINVPQFQVAHAKVSIYALFDKAPDHTPGKIADITGHEYVKLSQSNPASTAYEVDSRGWITGREITADHRGNYINEGMVKLTGEMSCEAGLVKDELEVKVVNFYGVPLSTPGSRLVNPFLEKVARHYNGPPEKKNNLVFIGEGFVEKADFDEKVIKIVDGIFRTARHSPFPFLTNSFNVWKVFHTTGEIGLTKALPLKLEDVVNQNGDKLSDVFPNNFEVLTNASNSYFGFIRGKRLADVPSVIEDVTNIITANSPNFADRVKQFSDYPKKGDNELVVYLDTRRYPLQFDVANPLNIGEFETSRPLHINSRFLLHQYHASLTYRRGDTHVEVGKEWDLNESKKKNKKYDFGFVCYLINDQLLHGLNCSAFFYVEAYVFRLRTDDEIAKSFKKLAYAGKLETSPKTNPFQWKIRSIHNFKEIETLSDFRAVIDTLVHEFGHSFNLGDEYEATADVEPALDTVIPPDNRTTISEIQKDIVGTRIVPHLIKWNSIYRIILSERITTKGTRNSDNLLTVHVGKIYSDRLKFWRSVTGPTVYIQPLFPLVMRFFDNVDVVQIKPLENPNSPLDYSAFAVIPDMLTQLEIVQIDEATGSIQLRSSKVLPHPLPDLEDAMLFRPFMLDGKPLSMIDPVVEEWMKSKEIPLGGFEPMDYPHGIDDFTVDAGATTTISSGGFHILSGKAIDPHNPQGTGLTFKWEQTAGPIVNLSTSPDPDDAVFNAPTVHSTTVFTFKLTVSNGPRSATDTVAITVLGPGEQPDDVILLPDDRTEEYPSSKFIDTLKLKKEYIIPGYTSRIVGLYEGTGFLKGYYRPAGACKMRNPHPYYNAGFCPVCQYLIIHRIDPSKHFIQSILEESQILSSKLLSKTELDLYKQARDLPR